MIEMKGEEMIQKIDKITEELDRILAALGLILALLLILVLVLFLPETAYRYIEAPIMLFLACVVYLLIRKRIYKIGGLYHLEELHANRSIILILNILFVSLFSYSIFSVAARPELYSRPLGYFISTSILAAILSMEILYLPQRKGYSSFILLKIMLIALSLRWTPQLIFPGLLGIDPWWHQMFTTKILELGYIPDGYAYSKLPVMHLIIGLTSLITGLDYKLSTMCSICLLQVISLIFIFIICSKFIYSEFIYSERVGLLASLLLAVTEFQIQLGYWVRPILLGIILLLIIIYLLFKKEQHRYTAIFVSLAILTSAILILTHTIAALAMSILLFSFWCASEIYKRINRDSLINPVGFTFFLLFSVGMFSWWMYASGHITTLARLIEWGFKFDKWAYSGASLQYIDKFKTEYMLNTLAFNLFSAFFILGSFYSLKQTKYSFTIVLGGYLLAIMIFLTTILGLTGFLQIRWYPIFQVIASFPAGAGLLILGKMFKNDVVNKFSVCFLVFILSFFAITTPIANIDHPLYSKNIFVRHAYTESEMQGASTILEIYDGKIGTDTRYALFFVVSQIHRGEIELSSYYGGIRFAPSLPIEDITNNITLKEYQDLEGLVVIRTEIIERPFYTPTGCFRIEYSPLKKLDKLNFIRIYDSGTVYSFLAS